MANKELTEQLPESDDDPCACTIGMAKWMEQGDTEDECRSCLLAPVTQWYRDELEERGLGDVAKELEDLGEGATPIEIAQKLDEIKDRLPDDVRTRLREFDCSAQVYEQNAG